MRTPLFAVSVALSLMLFARPTRADSFFHLPCDSNAGFSLGGGFFTGRTHASGVGNIEFRRIIIGAPRLELTIFENCGRDSKDRRKVTRWWLGRLNIFGAIVPERAKLSLRNEPEVVLALDENGMTVLNSNGSPVTTTKNTLTKADLNGGTSTSYSFGARVSLVDAKHFHVEAYYEQNGTFGWHDGDATAVEAHVNGANIDVTPWVREFAQVVYRFTQKSYGVTVGIPLKSNTTSYLRVTPFLTVGRMLFSADVEARIEPGFVETLTALGVDANDVAKRRGVKKSSWSGNGGARLDVNDRMSVEASLAYGKTGKTTIYVGMFTATARFNLPF